MHPARLWRWLLVSLLAVLLVACKPYASFTVSPDPVVAGQAANFDASGTLVDPTVRNNTVTSYTWDFGDKEAGTGKTATHTYATAGTYTVKLTVKDKAGQVGSTTQSVTVQPADSPTTTSLKVRVQIAGGAPLKDASVTLGALTSTSGETGLATLGAVSVGANQVLTIRKPGYIAQTIQVSVAAGSEPQQVLVMLLPEKETLNITEIAHPQVIAASQLGASVTLPANALINARTGAPATGAARLKLTPWDITGLDLQAMPGNGVALNGSGQRGYLVSAGMLTVEFTDSTGEKLQLAEGKRADIQVNLPTGRTAIDGHPLVDGAPIPMWHFNEVQGLWEEQGTGSVVSQDGRLSVRATVSHFSTWDWSYLFNPDAGTVRVQCESSTGVPAACSVLAEVTLPDGFRFTRTVNLAAEAATAFNMPAEGSVQWTATTASGLMGTATSSTNGADVVINLSPPTTSNLVQCQLGSGQASACQVSLVATMGDGSVFNRLYKIPVEGAQIETTLTGVVSMQWSGTASARPDPAGNWLVYTGSITTAASGSANVVLSTETVLGSSFPILVSCSPNATVDTRSVPIGDCRMTIVVRDGYDGPVKASYAVADGLGGPVTVTLPPLQATDKVLVSGWTSTNLGVPMVVNGTYYEPESLTPYQSIVITIVGFSPVPET